MPTAMHTYTGLVVDVPQHILESELGKSVYIEVPEGTKPLVQGMFQPGNSEEFVANNRDFSASDEPDDEIEDENEVSDEQ